MSAMNPGQSVGKMIADMTPEERERTLADLLHQQQATQGDDSRKVEDALLLLRLRPKVLVTTYIPLTRRFAERTQDRKVWDAGIIDPLADEDIPGRPQIVKVATVPDGDVLFERDQVLGLPGVAEPIRVPVPPPEQRRMVKPASADLDEGSTAEAELGPETVPVDPQVLSEMFARLEDLEKENTILRSKQAEPEPTSPAAKAADRRRKRAEADDQTDKQPETVGAE